MQDFACTKAEEIHYKELSDRVAYLKGTEKGSSEMCEIMDEIYAEGEKAGLEMGPEQGTLQLLFKFMIKQNLTFENACAMRYS